MISSIQKEKTIESLFSIAWVNAIVKDKRDIVIKINLARVPQRNHPRTDTILLDSIVRYFLSMGCHLTICESADGYLQENIKSIGLEWMIDSDRIEVIDLDKVEYSIVMVDDQEIAIPTLFSQGHLNISIPCTSKRERMLFSSNVKNFFGATPREIYLRDGEGRWRSKLHDNLDQSVMNVFRAFEDHARFDLYINGGIAHNEKMGDFEMGEIYISDDAVELDQLVFERSFSDVEMPGYLRNLIDVKKRGE